MTQEERDMLADLAKKIAQTPSPARDADAEDFIRKNIGSRPDALYLMTQTVLIQNMAIQQAQRQIQDLQQRSQQPVPAANPGGSFLGGPSSGRPQYTDRTQYSQQYQPAQPQPQYAPPPAAAPAPSAMSGFLRGAAQTAAGVAAGTLAVQGIESLFSHHGGGGGLFGGEGFSGGGGIGGYGPGETVIENNYYGDPAAGAGGERFADNASDDYRDDGSLQPQDAAYDDSDTQVDDASSFDDTSTDDNSGTDDNFA